MEWWERARCKGRGEVFYTDSPNATQRARAFCAVCPVWLECLTDALEHSEKYGLWGGLRPIERRCLVRIYRRLKHAPASPAIDQDIESLAQQLSPERISALLGPEVVYPTRHHRKVDVRRRPA